MFRQHADDGMRSTAKNDFATDDARIRCEAPWGAVAVAGDCDDRDATVTGQCPATAVIAQ